MQWPVKSLGCLSEKTKLLTCHVRADVESVIPVNKYSCVHKLFRITALVLKFINKLMRRPKDDLALNHEAKIYWIKHEQSLNFKDEITFLTNPGCEVVPPLVNNLNLFLDQDCIIRCKGRFEKSNLDYETSNPILLSRNSNLTSLLVWDAHKRRKHMGVASTLSCLRTGGLWVPKGRAFVKKVLSECITCKKINSNAYKYPKATNYLKDRVNYSNPYQSTGIDCTGHMYVRQGEILVKMYLVIFTCLSIRAIHIELIPSLTCKDFLQAFIRFCNTNVIPGSIYSDNVSTFLQAMGIIANATIDNDFTAFLIKNNIRHLTIPLYSAWAGTYWERMIRTVKSCLTKTIGRKHINYFELLTLITDVQHCVNSRSLTYLDEDSLDIMSPNSFLKFDSGRSLLFGTETGRDFLVPGRKGLVAMLERREELLSRFKEAWFDEYLLSLRESSHDVYQPSWQNSISAGDIVLISSPNKPRAQYQLGKVTKLLNGGADARTRCARVMRPDRSQAVYSINLLYPLELKVSSDAISRNPDLPSPPAADGNHDVPAKKLPQREAAKRCLMRLRQCN